jgi:hypothetical protein
MGSRLRLSGRRQTLEYIRVSATTPSGNRFSLRTLLIGVTVVAFCCWLYAAYPPFGPLYLWLLAIGALLAIAFGRRNGFLAALSATLFCATLVVIPYLMVDGLHVVSVNQLRKVKAGATANAVRSKLG